MKYILVSFLMIFAMASSLESSAQDTKVVTNDITTDDLSKLIGDWKGSLTYLNYGTNEPYTMPADLKIEQGKNKYHLILNNIYPKEPQANRKGKVTISKDGKTINKEAIISRSNLENGQVQYTTQFAGKDDSKKAQIRITYLIGENNFSTKKEVKFENTTEWLMRNEFKYSK